MYVHIHTLANYIATKAVSYNTYSDFLMVRPVNQPTITVVALWKQKNGHPWSICSQEGIRLGRRSYWRYNSISIPCKYVMTHWRGSKIRVNCDEYWASDCWATPCYASACWKEAGTRARWDQTRSAAREIPYIYRNWSRISQYRSRPKILVNWSAVLLCIPENPPAVPVLEAGNYDLHFSSFCLAPAGKLRDSCLS
jgi:hypothetical protein